MARFVKKLGNQCMKYMFEMTLISVDLRVPYEVDVQVVLKRGPKRLESKSNPEINRNCSVADFHNEKITMLSSIYKDKAKGTLQERSGNIIV